MLCARGGVYSMLGPSAQELLNNSRSTCGEPLVGRCDGNTAVRRTAEDEGGAHVTRTHCEELGLTCGMIDGKAGCVEAL
jgi:hypothetical protein